MVVKLDISKAYDRVKCDFLRAMMQKMLFSKYFVTRIFQCIQSVGILNTNQRSSFKGLQSRELDRVTLYLCFYSYYVQKDSPALFDQR